MEDLFWILLLGGVAYLVFFKTQQSQCRNQTHAQQQPTLCTGPLTTEMQAWCAAPADCGFGRF